MEAMEGDIYKKFNEKNKRFSIQNFFIGLAFFLFFYNPPLFFIGVPTSASKLVILACIIHFAVSPTFFVRFVVDKRYWLFITGTVSVMIVFYVISNFVHLSNGDNAYIKDIFLYILESLLGGYYLCSLVRNKTLLELINILIVIAFLQSTIMILAIVNLPLKQLVFDIKNADPASSDFSKWGWNAFDFRGLAIASDSRLGLSIFHATVCAIILWRYQFSADISRWSRIKLGFSFCIIGLGGVLGARTFFVGIAVYFFLFLILSVLKKFRLKKIVRLFFSVFIIITVVSLTVIPILIRSENNKLMIDEFSAWAFEFFNAYEDTGSLQTGSTDDLFKNHLKVMPQTTSEWLIGDNNRSVISGRHYVRTKTDSGYLLLTFHVGILGSLFLYGFWIFVFLSVIYLYKISVYKGFYIVMLGLCFTLFICQIKTDFMPGSALVLKIPVLFWIYALERFKYLRTKRTLIN